MPVSAEAIRFLAAVTAAPQHVSRGVGLGDDIRLSGSGITAAALAVDGSVIHLGAFIQSAGA